MANIQEILAKPPRSRSDKEQGLLLSLLRPIPFFKERDIKSEDLREIVDCFSHQFCSQG
jgi:hypothetical protein